VRQFDAALQDAIREASDGLVGRIRVKSTQAACMSCVQRLEQVKGFPAAHLTDNNPVRPVAQGCFQQIADCHCGYSRLLTARFKSYQVALANVQLGGVFDKQN
jgi:hypothetical protein